MSKIFVKSYEKLSEKEIISQIKNGDYELLQVIIDRYYPTICSCARKYCPASYTDDAVAEATVALYSAVKDFDEEKSSFSTFANLCIRRAVIGVLKNSKRKRSIPEELLSSIDEHKEIIDSNSPEKIFFDREEYKNLTDTIRLELSALEYKVLECYLAGDKYCDIAKKLDLTEKSVNNALTRIRKKLKK